MKPRFPYLDFIILMMRDEGPVEDRDDAIAHKMHVSARLWRSVKARLIDQKKIIMVDGRLANERCLMELHALLGERQKRSSAASIREAEKQVSRVVQPRVSAEPTLSQRRTNAEPTLNQRRTDFEISKKASNIKTTDSTVVPPMTHYARASLDLDLDLDLERESGCAAKAAPFTPKASSASRAENLPKSAQVESPVERPALQLDVGDSKLGVVLNCEAIHGPNFSIPFSSIDLTSVVVGIEPTQGRLIVEAAARSWVANGIKPHDPLAMATAALKAHAPGSPKPKRRAPPKRETKIASRLLDDWVLPEDYRASAREFGFQDAQIDFQARKFKNYYLGGDCPRPERKDWPATWRTWITNAFERSGGKAPSMQGPNDAGQNPYLVREPNTPEPVWQARLRHALSKKFIDQTQAERAGLRP
jgi:hypothetical protein